MDVSYRLEQVNEQEMLEFGEKLARNFLAQDVVILTGDLGAGKTTFTKGLALGLDIHQMVKSPTYTIVRELDEGRLPLYHMDVYRIGDDPDSFDLDDYLFGDGVSVIEWGQLLRQDLPDNYLEVLFEKNEDSRNLELIAHGKRYEELLTAL